MNSHYDPKRRQFLQLTGLGLLACAGLPGPAQAMLRPALNRATPNFQPDVELELVSRTVGFPVLPGTRTTLQKYFASVLKGPGNSITDIPGSYLGPLLRFQQGQKVRIHYRNEMDQPSITHWHGLHVSAAADGHPMYAVQRGETYVYEFEVLNRAGTYIYHSHAHEQTAEQVYQGLASGIIVTDEEEQRLGLPSGEFDLPVVIQDRSFDKANQLVYVSHPMERMTGFHGERILINGSTLNEFSVASRAYRLRLVNASNARIYKLGWQDGTPLTVIGCDGGLLEKPETRPYVMLAPGERLDLWADFSGRPVGSELVMFSKPFHGVLPAMAESMLTGQGGHGGMGGGMGGMRHNDSETGNQRMGGMGMGRGMMMGGGMMNMSHQRLPLGSEYPVFKVRIARQVSDSPKLPTRLSSIKRYQSSDVANPNKPIPISISEKHMSMQLNGRPYKMDDVQDFEKIKVNTIQAMEIFHDHHGGGMMGGMGGMMSMAHPIHLHGQQFQIVRRQADDHNSGYASMREGLVDSGWKDTVLVMPGERISIIKPFQDYSGLFMYHCHNLEHEDMGMMREFQVID